MQESGKKRLCVSGIVLGIIGIVFSLFLPAVTYSCSVTGLAIGLKKRHSRNSAAAIVLNIIAICMAAVNSVCGIILTLKMYLANKAEDEKNAKEADESNSDATVE